MIKRIIVNDIFNRSDREELEFEYQPELSKFIPDKYREGHVINTAKLGRIEPEDIDDTAIADGDEITIIPEVRDTGDFRHQFTLTASLYALASDSVQRFIQKNFISTPEIKPNFGAQRGPGGDGTFEDSPSYGWDGIHTTSNVDVPVPVVYGKTRVGGNVINTFIESDNNNDQNHINLLIAVSEGLIKSIGGIEADADGIRGRYNLWEEPQVDGKIGAHNWPDKILEVPVDCTGLTKANGTFYIDIKCSDASTISSDSQIEIGSAGKFDVNEWHFPDLTNLTARDDDDALVATSITNEWQTFELAMSSWVTTGGEADVTAINWIRVFNINASGNARDESANLYFRNAKIKIGTTDLDSIGDKILLDNNPIGNYRGVELSVRLGSSNQTTVPGFHRLHRWNDLRPQNKLVAFNVPQTYTTTLDDVDAVKVHLELPALYTMPGDSGNFTVWHVRFRLEYRVHDEDNAQPWTIYKDDFIEEMSTNTVRRTYYIEGLTGHRYDIRVSRTSPDAQSTKNSRGTVGDLFLVGMDEIRNDTFLYPHTALLGVRVLATDQLSGTLPDLSIEVEGRVITDWDSVTAYTNNPVVCSYDLLTNTRYGAGQKITPAMIDTASFDASATYSDAQVDGENRFELDLVLDGQSRALDMLGQMAISFRASFYSSAGKIRCIIDKETTASQLFTMGNIVKDSYSEAFASLKASMNVYEVQFIDGAERSRRDTVAIGDEIAFANDDPIRKRTMFIPAITRRSQAQRIANYFLLQDMHNIRTISFRAATDAVACQGGDVINFAHDVPAFGLASGRVKSGAASTVTLKESVTIPFVSGGDPYSITVRIAADDTMETKRITSPPGIYTAGTALDIEGTWSTNPSEYDIFSIGPSGLTGGDEYFWLQMNDNAASATVLDSSSNGNDQAITSDGDPNTDTHSVAGKIGTALYLDNSSPAETIRMGTDLNSLLGASQDFSVAFWWKADSTAGHPVTNNVGATNHIQWHTAGTTIAARFTRSLGNLDISMVNGNDGAWRHFVMTRSGTTVEAWMDNAKAGTNTTAENAESVATSSFWLGGASTGAACAGTLDDFRAYDRALTDPEIATLYNSGNGTVEPIGASGGTATITKPFRIISSTRKTDFEVEITAREYNEEVFSETGIPTEVTNYTILPDPRLIPPHVENLSVTNSAAYDRTAIVGFTKPDAFTLGTNGTSTIVQSAQIDKVYIYSSIDGRNYEFAGTTTSNSMELRNLIPGKTYYIRAVAVSKFGVRADKGGIAAPVVVFTYDSEIALANPRGLELFEQNIDADFLGQDAHFVWKDNSRTLAAHGIGVEPFGAGTGARDAYFKDFVVEIYVGGTRVRREYTMLNEFTYTYLKNLKDNDGLETSTGAREFTIRVWARDDFNRLSERAGWLDVTNPAPAALIPRGPFAIGAFPTAPEFTATLFNPVSDVDFGAETIEHAPYHKIEWEPSSAVDTVGYVVHRYTDDFLATVHPITGWSPTAGNLVTDTVANFIITDPPTGDDIHYYKIAPYDIFGNTIADLNFNPWGVRVYADPGASPTEFLYW